MLLSLRNRVSTKAGVIMPSFIADHVFTSFPILVRSSSLIGFVDFIETQASQITLEGWTIGDEVGLLSGQMRISDKPSLARDDVVGACPELSNSIANNCVGFRLVGTLSDEGSFFFVRHGLDTYYFHL